MRQDVEFKSDLGRYEAPFLELEGGIDTLPTPETESSDERTAYPSRRGRGRDADG